MPLYDLCHNRHVDEMHLRKYEIVNRKKYGRAHTALQSESTRVCMHPRIYEYKCVKENASARLWIQVHLPAFRFPCLLQCCLSQNVVLKIDRQPWHDHIIHAL